MRDSKHSDRRGDKPAKGGKAGLMFPLGNAHWEKDIPEVELSDGRYSAEMNECEDYKKGVDAMAGYMKKHREKH
jgi:hypothetical protein